MDYKEAKSEFIQAWGTLGSNWGINRTMSQIHALLLASSRALSAEEIMEELQISRGNANMNIRALIDWGLVKKELVPGERKEFFRGSKGIEAIARQIARERRKRELVPIIDTMQKLDAFEAKDKEGKVFKKVVSDMLKFSKQLDMAIEKFERSDKNWFYRTAMKLLK